MISANTTVILYSFADCLTFFFFIAPSFSASLNIGKYQGFSQGVASPDSARKRAFFLGMWKILARLRRAKIFHILKKKARVRAESGEATTFEKS